MSYEGTTVPRRDSPAGECDYCGHPFPTTDRLVLHKGLEHPQELDADEEDARCPRPEVDSDGGAGDERPADGAP